MDDRAADELARTATAVGSGRARGSADDEAATLGRYRLERELGAGGMGVVYAAFDPDLERRVAIKVLRGAADDSGADARARLLREARAMARLAHPNVVAVYEVGSIAGRDFVAMELIDGGNVAEWMREARRSTTEVLDVFAAAGAGLAAAHAAGLIHRDFKPHNVLRAGDGRVCVTDFGLARASIAAGAAPPARADRAGDSLSGLTQTGSVLGTPAYMAPEQWLGASVGPAADQFAYCVALWEALAGERPYRGDTLETLRTAVARGPAALDDSRIPRNLRATLRRGLDPDPAARWLSIDALLAVVRRARGARRRRLIGAGTIAVAAAIGTVASWPGDDAAPAAPSAGTACAEPARGPLDVWSPFARARVRATNTEAAAIFDRDIVSWHAVHDRVCAGDRAPGRLACLDGALAHLDVAVRAFHVGAHAAPVYDLLLDPAVCAGSTFPRLTLTGTADAVAAAARWLDLSAGSDALAERPDLEPCALALALGVRAVAGQPAAIRRPAALAAVDAADRCGDDRIRVDALLIVAGQDSAVLTEQMTAAVERLAAAADRVPQDDVRGELALARAQVETQQGHLDEGIALADRSVDLLIARGGTRKQLQAVVVGTTLRLARARPDDLLAVRAAVAHWRPIAVHNRATNEVRQLDLADADVRFDLGDVAGAHAAAAAAAAAAPRAHDSPLLTGTVVDPAGQPVAGAAVAGATVLISDSAGIGYAGLGGAVQLATSDAAGRFALPVPSAGDKLVVQAESGALRSSPARVGDGARIMLGPTARIAGRVALGGVPPTEVMIEVHARASSLADGGMFAPVAADGSFAIDRVPVGDAQITAMLASKLVAGNSNLQLVDIAVRAPAVTGIELGLRAGAARSLDVIARSTIAVPLDGVQVLVLPPRVRPRSIDAINNGRYGTVQSGWGHPLATAKPAPEVVARARTGDFFVHFDDVAPGELTLCAIGLSGDFSDTQLLDEIRAHHDMFDIRCQPLAADAKLVVIDTPPMKRAE